MSFNNQNHTAVSFHGCSGLSDALERATANIEGYIFLPNGTTLSNTLISLNDGEYKTYSQQDGRFILYDIPPGVHSLDVHDQQFFFSQVKIQLLDQYMDSPKCIEYIYPGAIKQQIQYPLKLVAHGSFSYFDIRPVFSPFSLLKNPMVLLMVFGVIMIFVMPSMMENLDEDQKMQFKKQMEMQKDPTKLFSSLIGDLSGKDDTETNSSVKKVKRDKDARRLKRE
jgi:hypothetical protein